jgi:iron complex outermembrane receptor protein
MRSNFRKFLLISINSIVTVVSAQDFPRVADSTRYELAPVIVTATRSERALDRVPYAISVIAQQEIQRGEVGLALDEALRSVPGVVVNNRFNLSQGDRLMIRGLGSRAPFGVRGVKIILDGIPLTMADGQSQLNNLDLGSAGKIEILRGPGSSLYGNAAGGVVNIQTEINANRSLQFQPQFIAGSYGLQKGQGKISGRLGPQTFLINVSHLRLEGFRENSAAQATAMNAVGHRDLSRRFKLAAVFNYFDAPYLLNPSSLSKADAEKSPAQTRAFVKQQGASKNIRQGQGGVTLNYAGENSHLESTIYGLSRTLLNPIPGRIIELDRTAAGFRAVYEKRRTFGSIKFGADYEQQKDTRAEFENLGLPNNLVGLAKSKDIPTLVRCGARLLEQKESVNGIGAFAEIELTPHPRWALTLGERYDRYDFEVTDRFLLDGVDDSGTRRMEKFSPMLGWNYRPHPFLSFYGNVATAFQTPTTTELSNRPTGEGGIHPALQPERIISYELGLKGAWPKMRCHYDITLYSFRIKDMLIPYQIAGRASEEVFYRNAGRARNKGVEIQLEWSPFRSLRTTGAYTWMDFVFQDFLAETATGNTVTAAQLAGRKIPGVPPQRIFASLVYERRGAFAEINWQWNARFFTNDFNGPFGAVNKPASDFVNEAYHLVDLRLGWQRQFKITRFEIFAGMNNVFAERYSGSIVPNAAAERFFEPAAKRNWYAGGSVLF